MVLFSDFGCVYEFLNNFFGVGILDVRKFLVGSYKFIVDDIEVFWYSGKFLVIIVYFVSIRYNFSVFLLIC